MKNSAKLREERADKKGLMAAILAKAETEKRDLTEDEKTKFDEYRTAIEGLDKDIQRAEFAEKMEAEKEARNFEKSGKGKGDGSKKAGEARDKSNIISNYSFARAINALVNGKPLDGLEAEMHQEAVKEARAIGYSINGTGVPRFIANPESEKRDMTAGVAADGGNTIATDLGSMIEVLTPNLVTRSMGITYMPGMSSDFDLPKQTSYSSAEWEGENDDAAQTQSTIGLVSFRPKRLAAFTNISLKLIVQSNLAVENYVRTELQNAISIAVDKAVINGSGVGQPTGILSLLLADNTIVGGVNGAIPTRDNIVDLEGAVDIQNALMGTLGYITTPGIRSRLKKTKVDAGSGQFLWNEGSQSLNGYKTGVSTQVPSNLTKGTGTNLNAIIFGNFMSYILAQFGGLDLTYDPYTQAKKGLRVITTNSFWDGNSRHDESFAAMIDAIK